MLSKYSSGYIDKYRESYKLKDCVRLFCSEVKYLRFSVGLCLNYACLNMEDNKYSCKECKIILNIVIHILSQEKLESLSICTTQSPML